MKKSITMLTESFVSSVPEVYLNLQNALKDEDVSFGDLEKIINYDPGLAIRLLKIVNSPFYSFDSKIGSISHALSVIGSQKLSELVLGTAVMEVFRGIPKTVIDMNSFWMHSIATGMASKYMAEFKDLPNPDEFYLAGLLHDIGSRPDIS